MFNQSSVVQFRVTLVAFVSLIVSLITYRYEIHSSKELILTIALITLINQVRLLYVLAKQEVRG